MERLETLNSLIVFAILLQPLGVVSPVLAETVRMEYPAPTDPDPKHTHAPKAVNGVTYKYDANGNLIYDGERSIFWNQDNLPVRIEKGGQVVEFFYDANGRRIVKQIGQEGANRTVYVNQYYEQLTINNEQSSAKYYFANGRVAVRNTPSGGTPTLTYLHQDHLGSTVLATDSNSQKLTEPLSYFPYGSNVSRQKGGQAMSQSVNVSMNYLFTGQEKDLESALYNYNARLYNPNTGAFISADTVGSGNRFAYVKNNPVRFTDPTGLRAPEETPGLTQMDEGEIWTVPTEVGPSVFQTPTVESGFEEFLALANFLKERFPKGVTAELWTPEIRTEIEEKFGIGAAWSIEDSLLQSGSLQCLGLARAYTLQAFGVSLPRFGEGPEKVGVAFENFRWHEDMQEVEVGDIFFYQVQKPNGFYNHWAIVSEKTPSGVTLVEAVGAGFRSLGKAPGAILVNERTFDFSSGQITGLTVPLKEGLYGFYRPEK